jgi:aspartokinase
MAISDSLRRLLHIRTLEEEQRKIVLDSALAELHSLESTMVAMRARERTGREHVVLSSRSGDTTDRIAGLVECDSARRSAHMLEARISKAALRAGEAREEYLSKRVEKRQAETIIGEAEDVQDAEAARHEQQGVDEWFSARQHARGANRRNEAKLEIKDCKESGSIPEEELRSKL